MQIDETLLSDPIPLSPQPRLGKPYRMNFANRGPEWWFQESVTYRESRGRRGNMFVSWKCPYGVDGEPVNIDGVWFWQPTTAAAPAAGGE